VTATDFADIWNTSASLREAATRLGKTPHQASVRASQHRQAGVLLQYFSAAHVSDTVFVSAPPPMSLPQQFYASKS
jgi:hypothetical protein